MLDNLNKKKNPSPSLSFYQLLRQTINQTHAQDMLALFISTSDTEFVPYNTMLQYFYEQFTKQMYPICLLTPKNYKLLPHLVMGPHS